MEFSSFEFMYPESSMELIYLKTSMEPQNLSEKFHGINRKCSYELVPKFHGIYPKIPWNLVHWNSCIPIPWNSFISKLPWNPRIYPQSYMDDFLNDRPFNYIEAKMEIISMPPGDLDLLHNVMRHISCPSLI